MKKFHKSIPIFASILAIALIVVSCSLISMGCATSGTTTGLVNVSDGSAPIGCENSLIYGKVRNPQLVKASLFLANAAALKKGLYSTDQVLAVLDTLDGILVQKGVTYQSVVEAMLPVVTRLNEDAGFVVIVLSPWLEALNESIPLTECDCEILRDLIQEMRVTVSALAAVG